MMSTSSFSAEAHACVGNSALDIIIVAAVFVASAAAILGRFGILDGPINGKCSEASGYGTCEVLQDVKSVLSFFAGVALCSVILKREEDVEDSVDSHGEMGANCSRSLQLLTYNMT
eukprot:TRINITY_DN1368_c0_g3_i1.p1 TRINITY_DN1368_c0_g3~~TRINITY_DN1368_c0_g3_i1.p1  ORF type:complete len:116 (-),score=20.79 TRINITY_DN1368_c0_g3_i1:249-596(-)